MTQRTLEQRVTDLERQFAELSDKLAPARDVGMTGTELVAFMREHGEALGPIFEEAMKLRQKDREKAYRKFDREQARKAARKRASTARQQTGS